MARLSRVVIPGVPHHVTQRGNGRQPTFFEDADYALYLDLLAAAAERARVEVAFQNDEWTVLRRGPEQGTEIVVNGVAELFGTEFGAGK